MNAFKAVLLIFTVLFAAAAVLGDSLECPTICPALFMPTCATDGIEYIQFDNSCALNVFNCKRQRSFLASYAETDIDWCTTTELDELDADLPTDLDKADPSCLRPCPMIFSPICGSNGTYRKSFSNECEMNVFNCLYNTKTKNIWRLLKQGKCSQTSEEEL